MTDAGPSRRTAEALLRLEREIMNHIRDRDARALGRVLSDDFVYRTPEAEVGREDFLRNIKAIPGRIVSVEGANQRVSVYGETAVLTGVQTAVVRTDDGVEHTGTTAFTDIFVKRRGRWKLALAYAVELPATSARQQ